METFGLNSPNGSSSSSTVVLIIVMAIVIIVKVVIVYTFRNFKKDERLLRMRQSANATHPHCHHQPDLLLLLLLLPCPGYVAAVLFCLHAEGRDLDVAVDVEAVVFAGQHHAPVVHQGHVEALRVLNLHQEENVNK